MSDVKYHKITLKNYDHVFNFHEANIEFGVSTVNGKGWYLDKNGYWIDIELFANKSEILTHIALRVYVRRA